MLYRCLVPTFPASSWGSGLLRRVGRSSYAEASTCELPLDLGDPLGQRIGLVADLLMADVLVRSERPLLVLGSLDQFTCFIQELGPLLAKLAGFLFQSH